jgi:general secretion pathway protein E
MNLLASVKSLLAATPESKPPEVLAASQLTIASEPQQSQIQSWFDHAYSILTLPGGRLEISDSQRRVALLFADGSLLLDKSNPYSSQILALREVVRRKGLNVSGVYLVEIELIRQLYEEGRKLEPSMAAGEGFNLPMQRDLLALLQEASSLRASDIHVYVHAHEADIKFRVRGDMLQIRQVSAQYGHELLATAYNMAESADATYRVYDFQAARISANSAPLPDGLQAVRLQMNPMGAGGRYFVGRLLYAQGRGDDQLTLERLGLHPQQVRALARMRLVPEGINIISGPTGSGKSTTLKIVLEQLYAERKQQVNILTIEDPPEYEIKGAAQLPVTNADGEEERGAAYRKAIVAALRSDPDVIMPGEARDREVINLVFTAAMTGHQVWTSLHANSAMAIFDRLRDQGVESYKLTDPNLLTGLTAQRLVKSLCPSCSLPLDEAAFRWLSFDLPGFSAVVDGHRSTVRLVNEQGCERCTKGYLGRMVLAEVVCPDQKFLTLMDSGDRSEALRHWCDVLSGLTMMEHGWLHMITGRVDPRDLVDRLGPFHGLDVARRAALLNLQ